MKAPSGHVKSHLQTGLSQSQASGPIIASLEGPKNDSGVIFITIAFSVAGVTEWALLFPLLLTQFGQSPALDTRSKCYAQPLRRIKSCLIHGFREANKDPFSPELGAGLRTARAMPKLWLANWFLIRANACPRKCHRHLKSQEGQGWD